MRVTCGLARRGVRFGARRCYVLIVSDAIALQAGGANLIPFDPAGNFLSVFSDVVLYFFLSRMSFSWVVPRDASSCMSKILDEVWGAVQWSVVFLVSDRPQANGADLFRDDLAGSFLLAFFSWFLLRSDSMYFLGCMSSPRIVSMRCICFVRFRSWMNTIIMAYY
jgi:hypothetical protein